VRTAPTVDFRPVPHQPRPTPALTRAERTAMARSPGPRCRIHHGTAWLRPAAPSLQQHALPA
jgi:hypothetical protein